MAVATLSSVVAAAVSALVLGGVGATLPRWASRWLRGRPHAALPSPAVVAVLVGALAAVVTVRWWGHPLLALALVLVPVLVVATLTDRAARIIPDRLTLRAPLVLGGTVAVATVVDRQAAYLVGAVFGTLLLPGLLLASSALHALLGRGAGVGGGDVKLAIGLGLALGAMGPTAMIVALAVTAVTSVGEVVLAALRGRRPTDGRVAYGPHLALGAVLVLVAGPVVLGAPGG